jgi:DNA polymerase/3'-5' exonuclease PolX
MPRLSTTKPSRTRSQASAGKRRSSTQSRYTVSLAPAIADNVARYARTADTSVSKAIAALVRLGLEGQERRKREFFKKLKTNLANDDPNQQDQMIDEFRDLILGR